MKKYFILLSLLALVAGCDAPQRTRAPSTYVNGNSLGDNPSNASGSFNSSGSGSSSGSQSGSSSGSGSGTPNSTPGFENCDLSDKYHSIDVGYFGICQSTQDETQLRFKTSLSSSSVRICLIPTYKDASGSSTWIGQPQCTYTTAGQVVSGKLYKDRNGFSTYPMNGVIVMKEPLLPQYFNCMQAYVNWPVNVCPNGPSNSYCAYWIPRCPYKAQTNAQCDMEGRNYMAQVCNQFKSQYSNSYSDIRLK